MKLTTEQRDEIERQRRSEPGRRSFMLQFTPEQRDEYRRIAAEEDAGREENVAWLKKLRAAEQEHGFSGDLRRAINTSRRPLRELAETLGVSLDVLQAFRAGEGPLPTDVVDRLTELLNLRLMAEIGRSR
jgi:hypothetical protein